MKPIKELRLRKIVDTLEVSIISNNVTGKGLVKPYSLLRTSEPSKFNLISFLLL